MVGRSGPRRESSVVRTVASRSGANRHRQPAAAGKRPVWERMLDRLRYGFGADGKARKRAREAARREASFNEQFADRESALPQRRYASYDDYVAHQASKLERIERRLRRVEDEDLDSFRANFARN